MPGKKVGGVRAKKRGLQRQRRLKALAGNLLTISEDAPFGTYRIDTVAMQIFELGQVVGAKAPIDFVKKVRYAIYTNAMYAKLTGGLDFQYRPERRRMMKRFFSDLEVIRSRIVRNKDVKGSQLLSFAEPVRRTRGGQGDALLRALEEVSAQIGEYLADHRPIPAPGGNHDDLTHVYIGDTFDEWCEWCCGPPMQDEAQLFVRLLAAGWRDAGLPADDEDGSLLETRLGDRVRKLYPRGVSYIRVDRQEMVRAERIESANFQWAPPSPPGRAPPPPPSSPRRKAPPPPSPTSPSMATQSGGEIPPLRKPTKPQGPN